ncbi:MAG: endolytic transglycosylase MltG [Sulfuricella sp.]|nr:endolytic transglycosylase MltG [Sulfuricella sp.]
MIKLIKLLLTLAFLVALTLAAWMGYFATTPVTLEQKPYEFTIRHGSSLRTIARQFADEKLVIEPWSFVFLVRLFGKANEIKAGNYLVENDVTPYRLFLIITRGDVTQSQVTFIEGWTFRQMRKALDDNPAVRHDAAKLSDAELLSRIEAHETYPEGLFFPDTYNFGSGMSDISILKRAYRIMQARLDDAWQARATDLPYRSPYEALIMASIIEKETGQASERPMIASVFINRLRIGMRLQTDPTVIYGLGESYDGNIRKRDLLGDTPYNTYTRGGLPPTPIAMPGGESVQAALHPAKSAALYFVAKGNGTHQFSASLAEHNRAVARYQLNR